MNPYKIDIGGFLGRLEKKMVEALYEVFLLSIVFELIDRDFLQNKTFLYLTRKM